MNWTYVSGNDLNTKSGYIQINVNRMKPKVLYHADVTDLKIADRKKRILFASILIIAHLTLVFVVALFIGLWAILVYILLMYLFLPSPVVLAPSRYNINSQGLKIDESKTFPLKKNYTFRPNGNRKFVSIRNRRKGELLRLYTPEPEKVAEILENLVKKLERKSRKS